MSPVTELITSIQDKYGLEQAARFITRLIRMPALWQAFTDPAVRQKAFRSNHISLKELDHSLDSSQHAELAAIIAEAAQPTDETFNSPTSSIQIGPDGFLETKLTIKACVDGDNSCLLPALRSSDVEIRRIAVNALLNVFVLEGESAGELAELEPDESQKLALDALQSDDKSIASILARTIDITESSSNNPWFNDSIAHWLNGNPESAQSLMEAAWDAVSDQAAVIADAIAQLAVENQQPIIEIQAYERAINARVTPRRRANLAVAKLAHEGPQAALDSLDKSSQDPFELIALGMTFAAMGQTSQAIESFKAVNLSDIVPHPIWDHRLVEGLADLGEMSTVINLIDQTLLRNPNDHELRRFAAEICLETGDKAAAVEHAQLLCSLAPEDQAATHLLAEAYFADDQAARALPIWSKAADQNPEFKPKAISAALAAGEINTALAFSQDLVEADPNSAQARLALGKSLIQAGNKQGGKVHIRRATELDPNYSEAWLELVRLAQGSQESHYQLLTEAAVSCPNHPEILSARAQWLEDQGRLTEAMDDSRQACELTDNEPALLTQQARILLKLDKPTEAKPLLEEVVRGQPANWPARIDLARIHEELGDIESALATLEMMPDEVGADAHMLLARVTLKSKGESDDSRGRQALASLSKASLDDQFESLELPYWQGRALFLCQRYEESLQRYQDCVKSLPEMEEELKQACLQGQAEAALASQQIPVAISILERARQNNGLNPRSLALLSKAYLAAGLADEALAPAVEACQSHPDDDEIRHQYLSACKASGSSEQALEKIDQWLEQDENDAELLLQKAAFHVDLQQVKSARKTLAQVAWQSRRDPKVLDEIAQLLLDANEPASAVRILINADAKDPNNNERLAQIAQAAVAANQPRIAGDAWNKVLVNDDEDLQALLGAAEACWQQDQRVTAIGFWQRALGVQPERADLHAKLARAQLINGETSQALDHFRSAVNIAPENVGLRLEAAEALMANNRYADALTLLNTTRQSEMELDAKWLSLLAQIYLGLGRPQEALTTVLRYSAEQPNSKLRALAAMANGRIGQNEQAYSALQASLDIEPTSVDEATWIARAALELGEWRSAHEIAHIASGKGWSEHKQIDLQLEIGCRIADAHKLLSTFGSAVEHAPAAELISQSTFRQLVKNIKTLEMLGQPESEIQAWRARINSAFGREESIEVLTTQSLPADHVIRQQALEGKALNQLEASRPEDALRMLASAPESLQAGPWSPLIAGIAHMQLKRPAIARKAFGAVDKGSPLWPLAAFLVGKCWHQEGRPDEAINSWNTAVLAWPTEFRWQSELALIYRNQGKPEAALPHLQAALEASPENHDLRLPMARSLFELGEISDAVEHYQQVLPQFKGDPEVLTEIGFAQMAAGQFESAYQKFKAALDISPQQLNAEVGAAQAAWHQGDTRLADRHSTNAIQRNVREPELVHALSEIMLASDKPKQAIALLENAFGHSQLPGEIARVKAKAFFETGDAQKAIKLLQHVVDQESDDDQSWAALARYYAGSNQAGQAIDALRIALKLRPGHNPYRLRLAKLFRETGQLDQALDELTSIQNENPENADIPLEIGLVHRARRQLKQALSAFQRSISLNQNGAAAYFQAGMVLKALKAYPQSVEMLEQAVAINPKDSEAMHQLAAVQALQLVHGGIQQTAVSG